MADDNKGFLLSPRDVPLLKRIADEYLAGNLGPGADKMRRRRPGGGGGGESKTYARIARSLQRPDPTAAVPVEAITAYRIKLSAEEEFEAWSGTHGQYEAEDKVLWEDGLDYQANTTHIAAEAKSPANASFWTVISPDAYVLGYSGTDLLGTVPWFEVGVEVEVVKRDGTYYIHETVLKCEYVDGEYLNTSIQWNVPEWRVMAVFR